MPESGDLLCASCLTDPNLSRIYTLRTFAQA
jgi:hypothetical protein